MPNFLKPHRLLLQQNQLPTVNGFASTPVDVEERTQKYLSKSATAAYRQLNRVTTFD
jgi:hypothetical protein